MSHDVVGAANSNLMAVLKFTAPDLEMNKQGKMSETQIRIYEEKMAENMQTMKKIMNAVMIICLVGMAFELLTDEKMRQNIVMVVPVIGIIFAAYYFGMPWYVKNLNEKNRKFLSTEGKVQCLSGKVELTSKVYNNYKMNMVSKVSGQDLGTSNILKIAGENIHLDQEAISALESEKDYNIYVVKLPPVGSTIMTVVVSAERTAA